MSRHQWYPVGVFSKLEARCAETLSLHPLAAVRSGVTFIRERVPGSRSVSSGLTLSAALNVAKGLGSAQILRSGSHYAVFGER